MGMGPIIWTCLALTFHQSPTQPFHLNTRNVGLPLSRKDQERNDIAKFILLYSADQGTTWEQCDSKNPHDPKPFEFHAPKDGVYWFLVQQVDRNGKSNPSDPNRAKPTMTVVLDTAKPQVKLTADRLPNGQIRARWTASDLYPEQGSLRLEYHVSSLPEGQWTPLLPGTSGLDGSHDFDPGNEGRTGVVHVRVQLKDQAGNVGEETQVLPATAAAVAAAAPSGPAGGSPFSVIPTARSDTPNQPNQLTSQQTQRSIIDVAPGGMTPPSPQPPAELNGAGPSPAPLSGMPIASNTARMQPALSSSFNAPANAPAVNIVKARQVRIDFMVGKVGPSGLGKADIYVTLDRGATWTKMPGEVPVTLAPGADNHVQDVTGSVGLELPAEAKVYGFIVAVKSKAGLGPPAPKPGELPQALVEWDNTAPNGQLFRPKPDPNQPNSLLLTWEASDRNLGESPITLEWAEQLNGPWYPISEKALPNSGQYPWRLPERLPPRVYLRLTMRDLAGNESRAQTDKPELIDLNVPQTKIIGVAPASR